MPKVKAPTPAAPSPETPAPDYSALIDALAQPLSIVKDAESQSKSGILDAVLAIREFKQENENAERNDIKTAIQTAVSNMLGIKLAKVQNNKANGGDDYAYVLASQMLNTAWPKGEAEEKRVAKAIEANKGWVEVRKASAKAQKRPARDPDANKITRENFASKLNLFLTRAQSDIQCDLGAILDLADEAVDAIRKAPPAA